MKKLVIFIILFVVLTEVRMQNLQRRLSGVERKEVRFEQMPMGYVCEQCHR